MAAPASYTESTLAQYMLDMLGATATALDWAGESLDEAVNDALMLYGVSDIASATDIEKLRACARLAAWQAVADTTTEKYGMSADGTRLNRNEFHEQAVAQLRRAKVAAMKFGVGLQVGVLRVRRRDDPYAALTDDERRAS